MSDLGNKKIMANNIKKYMNLNNKTRNEICHDLGFKYTTFSDWVNGKKYPRIDKIEMLANYFGIEKSDLVEREKKDNPSRIWKNVKLAREKINISQEELAELSNIPLDLIKEIEENKKIPDYELIIKLTKALNCEIHYIFFGEEIEELENYDFTLIEKIDDIMASDDEARKKLINAVIDLPGEDIIFMEKVLDALNEKKAD